MYETKQEIAADNAAVWRVLTVPELMRHWIRSVEELRTEDGAPLRLGSRLLFTARGGEHASEVTVFEPGAGLTLCSKQGPFTATYRYELASRNSGCVASLRIDCEATGVAKLLSPLIKWLMWRTDRGQLDAIKGIAETAS